MGLKDLLSNIKHNRDLYKSGKANKNEVRSTSIGWRHDPINQEDGQTPDEGNDRIRTDANGTEEYDTPSGNKEYYKVTRKGK